MTNEKHKSGDEALSFLAGSAGALGQLVRAYPGSREADDLRWLDNWFLTRVQGNFDGTLSPEDAFIPLDQDSVHPSLGTSSLPARIISVHPNYFRGFRTVSYPIPLESDLVVIDGRNSSGKTSLAEAIEWLFTGSLTRRDVKDLGNPRELENCISNQFRPLGEETWVEVTFSIGEPGNSRTSIFKRILTQDYGTASTSRCESSLHLNGIELTSKEERSEMEELFAGVPPLLMQHTLRLFVESTPPRRREYFERLLRLDELTDLISRAVVGDARISAFPGPHGNAGLTVWDDFSEMLPVGASQTACRQLSRRDKPDLSAVRKTLDAVARREFVETATLTTSPEIHGQLEEEQRTARRRSFPLLSRLRPRRQISDDQVRTDYSKEGLRLAPPIRTAWTRYESARSSAASIGRSRLQIAAALQTLQAAGLIHQDAVAQACPLCAYPGEQTLLQSRLAEIRRWLPTYQQQETARKQLDLCIRSLVTLVKKALEEYEALLPSFPSNHDIEASLVGRDDALRTAVTQLSTARKAATSELREAEQKARSLAASETYQPKDRDDCERFIDSCISSIKAFEDLPRHARRYKEALTTLESAVGAMARVDPKYRLRDGWLNCYRQSVEIADDLLWEVCKRRSQRDLEALREDLIDYRRRFLEQRRVAFNTGIQELWSGLRSDEYSMFGELHIPEPRGRGFPIEIEVKAVLDDGQERKEVDALRVFSESQTNALGIAAFVTRSKLLGHRFLVLDDPVQSMDEDHFKTFARDVIPQILSHGFQLIILTHNDTFSRDISLWHYDRVGYTTMSVRHSRREGCIVEEGNRRVAERLRTAEKMSREGRLDQAWKYVRLAVERLYVVTYDKYGPDTFNPESWGHQTAEYMWGQGAGAIIDGRQPNASRRLKEILDMTVGGTHDSPARGETDLNQSLTYLRSLLGTLAVGG